MIIGNILQTAGVVALTQLNQFPGMIDSTKNGKPSLVNVYAEYCGFSKQMAQPYANLGTSNGNDIAFYGADVVGMSGVTDTYGVKGLPTFIGYACGKEIGRVGGADEEALKDVIKKLKNTKC